MLNHIQILINVNTLHDPTIQPIRILQSLPAGLYLLKSSEEIEESLRSIDQFQFY